MNTSTKVKLGPSPVNNSLSMGVTWQVGQNEFIKVWHKMLPEGHLLSDYGFLKMSPNSFVGTTTGYGLDDKMIGVQFPAGTGNFSLRHHVQTCSGTHRTSYPTATGGSFPGDKAAESWSWQLTSTQFRGQRLRGAMPPLPQYVFMTWHLLKHRDKFYGFLKAK
jgi:hypothetical protein